MGGRISRPASTDASTPTVPAASTRPVSTAALATSTVIRRGIAVSVTRIMPVLYSPLIASTARMATTAWLRSMPLRLALAGSWPQPLAGQATAAAATLPTATVSADDREQQPHGAGQRAQLDQFCVQGSFLRAPCARRARRSCVPLTQQVRGHRQGNHGPGTQHREAGPRGQRPVACRGA